MLSLSALSGAPLSSRVAYDPLTRPASDVLTTGWTPSTGTDLWDCINEQTYDDGDYITSPALTGGQGPAIMGLTRTLNAGTYLFRLRADMVGAGRQLRASLLNDANEVQGMSTWTSLSGSVTEYEVGVTTTGAATRVELEAQ